MALCVGFGPVAEIAGHGGCCGECEHGVRLGGADKHVVEYYPVGEKFLMRGGSGPGRSWFFLRQGTDCTAGMERDCCATRQCPVLARRHLTLRGRVETSDRYQLRRDRTVTSHEKLGLGRAVSPH